jgi:hypothetical protein
MRVIFMKIKFQNLFEEPNIVESIIGYLAPEEGESFSFLVHAVHNKTLCTYERVQGLFNIYPPRTKGKKSASYGIYHAGDSSYETCIVGSIETISKSDVGFLAFIPVPYLKTYRRGSDRDPIALIRKYIKAICTLDPEYSQDNYTNEAGLEFARKRIRIIIGLNIKDDHFDLNQNTVNLYTQVRLFSEKINKGLRDNRWPAWVIPVVWGVDSKSGQEFYFDSAQVQWSNSTADDLRWHLRQVIVPKKPVKMSFPFASMRSFLFESRTCEVMLEELSALNEKVYFLTGDADLISLKPISKNTSVFNLVRETVIAHPDAYFMRLGGAYGFENKDIAQHIMSQFPELTELFLAKSVLMTQLLRCLDTATRRIMSQVEQSLAYYSEAHTYTVAEVFDEKCFKHKGNAKSPEKQNVPMTKLLRNSHLGEPDIAAEVTRNIRQPRNWALQPENREQKFLAERAAQLLTSSRHDLVVIRPSAIGPQIKKDSGIQVCGQLALSMENLKKMIQKQHNTQLTASQLNSRFREAGYGANGFHESVDLLPIIRLPFVVYFLAETRSEEAQAETANHAITSAGIPDDPAFPAIYKKLIDISARPEALLVNDPVIDIPAMRSIGTQYLNRKKKLILKAFFQLEYLLRWGVAMMHKIRSLAEPYKIEIKDKTVKDDDRFVLGDIFKKKGPEDALPTARTLDDALAGAMQGLSLDPKQFVSSNALSKTEGLVDLMQGLSLSEAESLATAKQESLLSATQQGNIGPRNIPSWTIRDVPDVGNCFYEAIIHQMQTINHSLLSRIFFGGVPHLYLRNILNSSNEGEWAEDRTIDEFVTKVPVILAIVDTRMPDSGYTCYYLGADGTVTTNSDTDLFLPTDKPIIRIAATGNHYLSIMQNPGLDMGRLRNGYIAPALLNFTSPSFFARSATDSMIEQRHDSADNQRLYDNRFGLVLR